jgi:hypothetical protein
LRTATVFNATRVARTTTMTEHNEGNVSWFLRHDEYGGAAVDGAT